MWNPLKLFRKNKVKLKSPDDFSETMFPILTMCGQDWELNAALQLSVRNLIRDAMKETLEYALHSSKSDISSTLVNMR